MQQPIPLETWAPSLYERWMALSPEFRAAREVPARNRIGITWHHTAGGTALLPDDYGDDLAYGLQFGSDHFNRWNRPGGYNFGITQDGRILEHTPPTHRGAHAGTVAWNQETIGVALYGNFQTAIPPVDQLQGARNLTAWLIDQGYIPAVGAFHYGHRDVRPKPTSCPGAAFAAIIPDAVLATDSPLDVPSEWAAEAWREATELGLMNGRDPKAALSREAFATVITRSAFKAYIRNLNGNI